MKVRHAFKKILIGNQKCDPADDIDTDKDTDECVYHALQAAHKVRLASFLSSYKTSRDM